MIIGHGNDGNEWNVRNEWNDRNVRTRGCLTIARSYGSYLLPSVVEAFFREALQTVKLHSYLFNTQEVTSSRTGGEDQTKSEM